MVLIMFYLLWVRKLEMFIVCFLFFMVVCFIGCGGYCFVFLLNKEIKFIFINIDFFIKSRCIIFLIYKKLDGNNLVYDLVR